MLQSEICAVAENMNMAAQMPKMNEEGGGGGGRTVTRDE
jgi:hypothetical protein